MFMNFIKSSLIVLGCLFAVAGFADSLIDVTVISTDKAAAVGFLVEGKRVGGLGKSYSGKGPVNKQYFFGYRKSAFSRTDIHCGSIVLDKSTKVQLVTKGEECLIVTLD